MTDIEIEKENKAIAQEYKELLRISYQKLSTDDKKLIRKAFDVAVDAHQEQRRKSGEAYIFHPIAVAKIVASQIGLGPTSIAAALLHDVVEDSEITVEDIEKMFNPNVAQLVDGLTKISKIQKALKKWAIEEQEDLLKGILILSRYQYPDLNETKIRKDLGQIKQDVWLELNDDLTAIEKVKVLNHIL